MNDRKSTSRVDRDASPERYAFGDKQVDNTFQGDFTTEAGVIVLLNGCITGNAAYNRSGRKITMTNVYLDAIMTPNPDTDNTYPEMNNYRIIVFLDRQPRGGSIPAITDLLGGVDYAGSDQYTASRATIIPINPIYADRFKILCDYVKPNSYLWTTSAAGQVQINSGFGPHWVRINLNLVTKGYGVVTKFNAGETATSSDIVSNALYCAFITNVSDAGSTQYQYYTRVYFKDN